MVVVKRNIEHRGIEIYFPSKPADSILTQLKNKGWRWHNTKKCWYNRYSDANYAFANGLCKDENTHIMSNNTPSESQKASQSTVDHHLASERDVAEEVYAKYGFRNGDKVSFITVDGYVASGKIVRIVSPTEANVSYSYISSGRKQNVHAILPVSILTKDIGYRRYNQFSEQRKSEIDFNEKVKNRIKSHNDNFSEVTPVQKNNVLFRHQRAGCLLAERYNKFAFFYDTGTGKTVMALDIISSKYAQNGCRFLIIAPKAIIQTAWMEDARKYYPELRLLPLTTTFGLNKRKKLLEQWKSVDNKKSSSVQVSKKENYLSFLATITENESAFDTEEEEEKDDRTIEDMVQHYIINAELFIRDPEKYIQQLGITGLIVDESAVMKNPQSTTSSTIIEAASRMKYVYLLSGKPAPNNELEYFSQMKAVDPDTFSMSFSAFARDFGVDDTQRSVQLENEAKEILSKLISARSLIISKDDCLDLPPTTDVVHQFELPDDVMQEYDKLYKHCLAVIKGMDHSTRLYASPSKLAVLMKLRQMASGFFITNTATGHKSENVIVPIHENKIKELLNIIDEIGNEQVIIWCQFKYEIIRIEKLLSQRGKVVTAYGDTKDVNQSIADFKNGSAKYIVAHPKTLKYGVTFTNCRYAIYYSFSYSAEDYDQSHDRIYRLGQTQKCTYFFLQAENTIDELMYQKVMDKLSNAEFFERLIKDASTHGIDYDSLKVNHDDDFTGVSDELMKGAVTEKQDIELASSYNQELKNSWDEIFLDSYGVPEGKSEAEIEIDELIHLTHLNPDDLQKLHDVVSGLLDKYERDYDCSMDISIVRYRHCLDLPDSSRNKRTWKEISRIVGRSTTWATEKYNAVIRKIIRKYRDVLEYIADVYIWRNTPEKTDAIDNQLFDFLTPPDPTPEEMAEIEIPVIKSEYYDLLEGENIIIKVGESQDQFVILSAINSYLDSLDNFHLVLKIDASHTYEYLKYNFDDITIYRREFYEYYKHREDAWTLPAETTFATLNLGKLPFTLKLNDEIDVYLSLCFTDDEFWEKKIHFRVYLREKDSVSMKVLYPQPENHYPSYADLNRTINETTSTEGAGESALPAAVELSDIAIVKICSYWNSLHLIFKIGQEINENNDITLDIKSMEINDKSVIIDQFHAKAEIDGVLYEDRSISRDKLKNITTSAGSKIKIQYTYEIRQGCQVVKSGSDSCCLTIEEESREIVSYSSAYDIEAQTIYQDENIEVVFLAAFENNDRLQWLIQMHNTSQRRQAFNIKYARINGVLLCVDNTIWALPNEKNLNLVGYRNPLGIATVNQAIELIANNDEVWIDDVAEYKCNPFIIREIYDSEYSPSLPEEVVNDIVEDFEPGCYFEDSHVGSLLFETCEDMNNYLLPKYGLVFQFKPVTLGYVILNIYINGYFINREYAFINKKEIITITSGLTIDALRWHGINLKNSYSFKIQVCFSPRRKDTVYMEKEYRICITRLLNFEKKSVIDINQLGNFTLPESLKAPNQQQEEKQRKIEKGLQGIYDEDTFSVICSTSKWKVSPVGPFFSKVNCFEDFKVAVLAVLPELNNLFTKYGLNFNEHLFSEEEEAGSCIEYMMSGEDPQTTSLRWKKKDPYLSEYILKYSEMCFRSYVCYAFLTWPEELTSFMVLKNSKGKRIQYLAKDKTIQERQRKYLSLYPQITLVIKNSVEDYLSRNGSKWEADKARFIAENADREAATIARNKAKEATISALNKKKDSERKQVVTTESIYEYVRTCTHKISLKIIMQMYGRISDTDKSAEAVALSNVIKDVWIIDPEGYTFADLKSIVIDNTWFGDSVSKAIDGDIFSGLPYFYSYHNVTIGTLRKRVKPAIVQAGVVLALTIVRGYLNVIGKNFEQLAYGEYYSGKWEICNGVYSGTLDMDFSKVYGKYVYTIEQGKATCSEYRPNQNVTLFLGYVLKKIDNALRQQNRLNDLLPINEKDAVIELVGQNVVEGIDKIIEASAFYACKENVYSKIEKVGEINDRLFQGKKWERWSDVKWRSIDIIKSIWFK